MLHREFPYASAVMITKASQKTNFFGADFLFIFGGFASFSLKYKKFFRLGPKKLHFPKKQETLQVGVPFTFRLRSYLLSEVFLVFPFPEI